MRRVLLALLIASCARTQTPVGGGDKGEEDGGGTGDDDTGTVDDGSDDTGESAVDADGDGWSTDEDCDDDDPLVHPGATERCNGIDDDCNDVLDDGLYAPWCLTSIAECPMQPDPPEHPEPLVHLSFEDPAHPETNAGSLDSSELSLGGGEWGSDTGALGLGLRLDKVGEGASGNDYLYFPTNDRLQVQTLTISAWVKPGFDNTRMSIVNMIWDSAPAGFSFDLAYGFLSLRVGDGTEIAATNAPIPSDTWSHVAATYDGEEIALYVDGQLRARERVDVELKHYPAQLLVGAYQSPLYYAYDGLIDELKLWDRALSATELRRSIEGARYRFEVDEAQRDWSPNALDETAWTGRTLACGPVGNAWIRAADEAPMSLPPHSSPSPSVGMHLWARPDSSQEAVLAEVDGAYSLRQTGEGLAWTISCEDGAEAGLTATDVLPATLWAEIDAAFVDGHLRLSVNGVEVANERAGCFELRQSSAGLVVGEGFAGGLDEIEVGPLPWSRARVARALTWSAWDGHGPTLESTGVQDGGPLSDDLVGEEGRARTEDDRYACLHLQATTREACNRVTGSLESANSQPLYGPATLHAWVRPLTAPAATTAVLNVAGMRLLLTPTAFGAEVGEEVVLSGGPVPEARWTPVALAVDSGSARLFIDGVLVEEIEHAFSDGGPTARFALDEDLWRWSSDDSVLWIEEAGVDGFAWTDEDALRRHAPWRTEPRGRALSSQLLWEQADFDWEAVVDSLMAEIASGAIDSKDESLSHYTRANTLFYLAEYAWQTDDDEVFEAALQLLEDMDHGNWEWSWIQGRALYQYAVSYDRIAAMLEEREAAEPHTWSPRHATLRRRFASTLHHIGATGGINDQDPTLTDFGYHHPDPSYLTANSRLMSVGGSGHAALMMSAMADPDFGHATDHLELAVDDLLYARRSGGEALGEQLRYFLHDSGLYVEGHGYQSDVFTGLTPFLIDWWQAGGEDRITSGRVRAMYSANVAAMLPTGHAWPYATGWLQWQGHNDVVAELIEDTDPDAAEDYRWFDERQYGTTGTFTEPSWTSAVLADEDLILRSDWSEEGLWLGLKGRTAPCPASHCQEDQMSLMLVAHGAWLLIDPGDGRSYRDTPQAWKEEWLQGAEGHNNVLVDGVGPGLTKDFTTLDDPATLTVSLLSDRADYGRMDGSVAAGGADHTRRVWLVDDSFFVLVDELSADGTATFSQQFHLGGPTTSGDGSLSTAGPDFSWATTNDDGVQVDLDVVQLSPASDLSLARYTDGGTNFSYPNIWDHRYVRAQQSGASATYVTLLLSGTATDPAPTASVLEDSATLRHAEVTLDSGERIEISWNGTGARVAPGSADFDGVLAGTDGTGWAFLAEGSSIEVSAELGAWATCALDALQLELDGGALVGTVAREASASCALEVAWSGGSPGHVEVDGLSSSAWTYDASAGVVELDPAPEVGFRLE